MDSFFQYCINPESDEPTMLINNYIGFDAEQGPGIMGTIFQRELMQLDEMNKKRIQVWINSPGGSVSDGYSIFGTMLKTKTPVDTYCLGMAASIAGVIFQAGRKRTMLDYSWLMYHNPYIKDGSIDKALEPIKDSICIMIASRSGISEGEIHKIMNRTTYILADEALSNGFCDEVENGEEFNKKRKVSTAQNMVELAKVNNVESAKTFWKESNKILNSIFNLNNDKMIDLKRINNKLGLNPDASDESTLDAITAIVNKAAKAEEDKKKAEEDCTKSEEDKKALKDKISKMEEDIKKAEEDKKALKDKLAKMEEDKKNEDDKKAEKEEEDKKDKAKNMIEGFVVVGKIPNDAKVIADWQNKAKEDFTGVKALFDALPLNRQAPKTITTFGGNDKPKDLVGSLIGTTMINIKNKLETSK